MESELLKDDREDELDVGVDVDADVTSTDTESLTDEATNLFSPRWALAGIALGLGIQLGAGYAGVGLLTGAASYAVLGVVMGLVSDRSVIPEAAGAGFLLAAGSHIMSNILMSLLGVGLVAAAGHGAVGLILAAIGGYIGQYITDDLF